MIDVIHEILNDHLVVVTTLDPPCEHDGTIKVIRQEQLGKVAEAIDKAIKEETNA